MGDMVKKIFQIIGFISLVCFSFFYTNKINMVIKESDDLLKQIDEMKNQYEIKSIDAEIIGNDIIPGVSGSSVDVLKSYDKMKKLNIFNSNLLVYENIKPNISVNKVYNKYIVSGNKNKKEVSIVFLLEDNKVEDILQILNKYNIKSNFFIDINWIENNNENITKLINDGHIVGSLETNKSSELNWINTIISKINNQNITFCYNESKNNDFLNICKLNTSYTITPSIQAFDKPIIEIKKNIQNGSIISLKINDKTIDELALIIEYINSKGYEIVSLSKLIEE